jgi:hypothetical protein
MMTIVVVPLVMLLLRVRLVLSLILILCLTGGSDSRLLSLVMLMLLIVTSASMIPEATAPKVETRVFEDIAIQGEEHTLTSCGGQLIDCMFDISYYLLTLWDR